MAAMLEVQNNKMILIKIIYTTIKFISQRKIILLFYTSNMAAVTSRKNPLYP